VVGLLVGDSVGDSVGSEVGTLVGAQLGKSVTVIFTSFPKSTQWPEQLENPICCHSTIFGTLGESSESS